MEHRDIEIFLALAEELHFGRAAERLHVSTSRVSQTIKKLERAVGTRLFERTSRRVRLTTIGSQLEDAWRPAYRRIHEAVEECRRAGRAEAGTLRIGFIGAASGPFVLAAAEAFRTGCPDVEVRSREYQFGTGTVAPLRDGEIDMMLGTRPARGALRPGLNAGRLLDEEDQLLAVPARHPFARRPSVSLADVADTTILRTPPAIAQYWDRALVPRHTAAGRPVERGPSFATVHELLALVGAGAGTYPVSAQFTSYYARPDVVYVPIHDVPPYQRRFLWLTVAETAGIRAFDRAAAAVATPLDRTAAP